MSRLALFVSVAVLGFFLLVSLRGVSHAGGSGESDAAPAAIRMDVEVWMVTDEATLTLVEAAASSTPGDAAAVRALLGDHGETASRVARLLAATHEGESVMLHATSRSPTRVAGPTPQGGFGGFVESGTTLEIRPRRVQDGAAIQTDLSLKVTAVAPASEADALPPGRRQVEFKGTLLSAAGGTEVVVWDGGTSAALVLLFQATPRP